ncbi:energy-coupling factor transporter transmembrane component T family protein [Gulosibacter faecalis]|uniref:Energy-coupling factor transporter transmembrane component T family protein n=1 Tax=Gulosibacter faecalis TaxID=272240 RepID=A0ABW5UY98_9MICO|nr:energy-coupling factor transporter transmembrane component T [Gulosibacter faecalis]
MSPRTQPTAEATASVSTQAQDAASARERELARIDARFDRATLEESRRLGLPLLHRIHPLVKLVVTLVPMIALFTVGGWRVPALVAAVALVLLVAGTRLRWRTRVALLVGVPVLALVLSVTLGVWVNPVLGEGTPVLFAIGAWEFTLGTWEHGLANSLRLIALFALAMLSGASTSGADFVRALVQHLRVPYRFGYAGIAAFRFVPRFRHELENIRRAHRARGMAFGHGPGGWLRRHRASLVPLLAGSMRHADRVALAMDARGFGYAATRTERHPLRFIALDWVFLAAGLVAFAACFVGGVLLGG